VDIDRIQKSLVMTKADTALYVRFAVTIRRLSILSKVISSTQGMLSLSISTVAVNVS